MQLLSSQVKPAGEKDKVASTVTYRQHVSNTKSSKEEIIWFVEIQLNLIEKLLLKMLVKM